MRLLKPPILLSLRLIHTGYLGPSKRKLIKHKGIWNLCPKKGNNIKRKREKCVGKKDKTKMSSTIMDS